MLSFWFSHSGSHESKSFRDCKWGEARPGNNKVREISKCRTLVFIMPGLLNLLVSCSLSEISTLFTHPHQFFHNF